MKVFNPPQDKKELPLRKKLGWKREIIIISTRSWENIYGIETLLKAFRIITLAEPNVRIIMLGGGSLSGIIDKHIAKYEMDRIINRPGVVENSGLAEYFKCADIYISCSLTDGSSISLLEAMASGLPVVVSDIPGNREWVSDGVNGFLAETGSGEAFAAGVRKLLAMSENERSEMGLRNQKLAEDRADWDKNFNKLMDLYQSFGTKAE